MGLTRENPIKEIIREFHQVMVPTPVPAPQQDNSQLIQALNQAVANNRDMARFAHDMGMSMQQLMQLMNNQLAKQRSEVLPQPILETTGHPPPPGGDTARSRKGHREPIRYRGLRKRTCSGPAGAPAIHRYQPHRRSQRYSHSRNHSHSHSQNLNLG